MSNILVASTLTDFVFAPATGVSGGETVSGTLDATYNAGGTLISETGTIALTETVSGSVTTEIFTIAGTATLASNTNTGTGIHYSTAADAYEIYLGSQSSTGAGTTYTDLHLDWTGTTSPDFYTSTTAEINLATGYGQYSALIPTSGGALSLVSVGSVSSTETILCFYPGTRIATPEGEIAVEALRAGEMVLTRNGARPVRWIGQSHVSTRFSDNLRSLPVRIKAGALGEGLPVRDLLVSPDHAICLGALLVQAGALVNGLSIVREQNVPELFTYYHVELESHELLLAEGVEAESFVDNAGRWHFQNWDERTTPTAAITEMDMPRVKSARQLPAALRQSLGFPQAA
jgi:hypothetical protein